MGAAGQAFTGKRLLLTGSPAGLNRITFEPPLPAQKARLLSGMAMANTARYNLVYADGPWWLRENVTGIAVDGSTSDPVSYVFDATPLSGKPGILQFWLFGDKVQLVENMPEPQRAQYLSAFLE